ncbi:MAG: hypothetical protein IH845_01355 [Nanoarchaeota archaeon]|nr:hypothetical protein [Nanoarchaeota archaeon]
MNKQIKTLFVVVLLVGLVFSINLVFAKNDSDDGENGKSNAAKLKKLNVGKGLEAIKLDSDGIEVKRNNGEVKRIRVLPAKASALAAEKFGNENINISLEEEEDGRIIYKVKAKKQGKFLGIFNTNITVEGEIDTETGEFRTRGKPWWAFLVRGEDSDQFGSKVSLCHIPKGNPASMHTITVGAPAVKAHLRHGDTLETCDREEPKNNETGSGNETDPGNETNQTEGNLTLTINSPLSGTYNTTEILVNIDSNGNFTSYKVNNGNETIYINETLETFIIGNNTLWAFTNNTEGEELSTTVYFFINLTIIDIPDENNNETGNETDPGNETNSTV